MLGRWTDLASKIIILIKEGDDDNPNKVAENNKLTCTAFPAPPSSPLLLLQMATALRLPCNNSTIIYAKQGPPNAVVVYDRNNLPGPLQC